MWAPNVHRPCTCNEVVAIEHRVLEVTPEPIPAALAELKKEVKMVANRLRLLASDPWSYEQVVGGYSGYKKQLYAQAVESLTLKPFNALDARLSAFVKGDKARLDRKFKAPRLIQARGPRYNVSVARWIKPLEHALYGLTSFNDQLVRKSKLIAKGLSLTERATVIREKMDAIPNCIVLSIDCSQFDKHVSAQVLKLEHAVYTRVYNDPELQSILSHQLRNKGVTSTGVKYSVPGNRASGDMNTALGNCLIMLLVIRMIARLQRWGQYDMFIDGDDTLLFLPASQLTKYKSNIVNGFLSVGFTVRVEGVYTEYEKVEHCQCKPVFNGERYMMCRNPYKVLSHLGSSYKHFRHNNYAQRMLRTMAKCEALLSRGLPISSVYASKLESALSTYKLTNFTERDDEFYKLGLEEISLEEFKPWVVTERARRSLERAWGISVPDQLAIERQMTIGDITVPLTLAEEVVVSAGGLLMYVGSDHSMDNMSVDWQ